MIKKIEGFDIPSGSFVRMISCGDVKKIVYSSIVSHNLKNYKKISRNEMLNVITGEIIECKTSDTRDDNIVSLRKTISRLRDLINCNFFGADNELFITMTYHENMTDYKRLYKDFDRFYKRLKYRFKDIEFCYISVVEPQQRGAWHIHLLLKALNKDHLFIDNSLIADLWGYGFCKTQRLRGVDNVGAYLSSYLTDLFDENGRKNKGARLYLYPAGINIYRCSRNCKRPVEEVVCYDDLVDYRDYKTYEVVYEIYDDSGRCCNVVKKEFYNLRRPKMVDDGTDAGKGGL